MKLEKKEKKQNVMGLTQVSQSQGLDNYPQTGEIVETDLMMELGFNHRMALIKHYKMLGLSLEEENIFNVIQRSKNEETPILFYGVDENGENFYHQKLEFNIEDNEKVKTTLINFAKTGVLVITDKLLLNRKYLIVVGYYNIIRVI